MDATHRNILDTFTTESIPTLDVAVLGALELLADRELQSIPLDRFEAPIVVGSGNAHATGTILFTDYPRARVVTEVDAHRLLSAGVGDGVVVISASGGKDATAVVESATAGDTPCMLITNTNDAPAAAPLADSDVFVLPKNREPYTYNTSTYLSMMAAVYPFDAMKIHQHITETLEQMMPHNIEATDAFTLIVPDAYHFIVPMLRVKFDELFGANIVGRAFYETEIRHAKTVVEAPHEHFVSIGGQNTDYGTPEKRMHVPLPDGASYPVALAVAYYVIGCIQRELPAYFADSISQYTATASAAFGESIDPIVE